MASSTHARELGLTGLARSTAREAGRTATDGVGPELGDAVTRMEIVQGTEMPAEEFDKEEWKQVLRDSVRKKCRDAAGAATQTELKRNADPSED